MPKRVHQNNYQHTLEDPVSTFFFIRNPFSASTRGEIFHPSGKLKIFRSRENRSRGETEESFVDQLQEIASWGIPLPASIRVFSWGRVRKALNLKTEILRGGAFPEMKKT